MRCLSDANETLRGFVGRIHIVQRTVQQGGEVRCPITEGKPFKFLGESRLEPATLGRCCDPMTVGRSRPANHMHEDRGSCRCAGEETYPPVEANQTLGSVFHVVPWAGQRLSRGPIFYNSHPSTTLHISLRWQVPKFQRIRRPILPERGDAGFTTELSDLQPR